MSDECVFCEIASGELESSPVYEDDVLISFMDIRPVTDGHLLVAPKKHDPYLADLDPETLSRMVVLAQRLAQAIRSSGLRCEGVNLFTRTGKPPFRRYSTLTFT